MADELPPPGSPGAVERYLYQDPTRLTDIRITALAEQVRRDMEAMRELLNSNIAITRATYDQKFTTVESRFVEHGKALDAALSASQQIIGESRKVHEERFDSIRASIEALKEGIQKQISERDVRTEQSRTSDKIAIDAAFLAQKAAADAKDESNSEASAKSEGSFTKQIDLILGSLNNFRSEVTARTSGDKAELDRRINELKERLDRGEGSGRGAKEEREDSRQGTSHIWGIVGGVVGLVGLFVAILTMALVMSNRLSAPAPAPALYGGGYNAPPTVVSPAVIPVQPLK